MEIIKPQNLFIGLCGCTLRYELARTTQHWDSFMGYKAPIDELIPDDYPELQILTDGGLWRIKTIKMEQVK